MARLFALGLVLCSAYLVSCAPTPTYTLEPMCSNEAFDFEDQKVNSFYRLEMNYTLSNLSSLLLPDDLRFETWSQNETEVLNLKNTKAAYNKLMEDFYERVMERVDSSIIYLHKQKVFKIWDFFGSFKSKIGFGESSSYYKIDSVIKSSAEFLHDLLSIKSDLLAPNLLKKDELKMILIGIEKQMNVPLDAFVFENHASHFYYNKRILQSTSFVVDQINKNATAFFTVFVPVYTRNPNNTGYQCRRAKLLPAFFNQL